jgi:4-alpha-glucanotransferase
VVQSRLLEQRRAGVLLHPTSLDHGHGVLGADARAFIDWLAAAGFSVWQLLPLAPVGADGSPYWARSDLAGNPLLIDQRELPHRDAQRADYDSFVHANAAWLDDYAMFEALSQRFSGAPWWDWPAPFRDREPASLARARDELSDAIERQRLEQWQFDWQWGRLRSYAAERGVRLFGDLPIYVAPDSVSTWAHRDQFLLQPDGRPAELAGVPPDYFAVDGQLWGNPPYNWAQAERDGFAFWRERLARQLQRFDMVRIDHFRGLAAYWSVPAGSLTARHGRWVPAPGHALLAAIAREHPDMPFIAEDLGVITADVDELRHAFGLPGMRVLQFGFDASPTNPHAPHNYTFDVVAYTGTHDNDTTVGWYRELDRDTRRRVALYLGVDAPAVPHSMVRAALACVARLAILPAQDLLKLGSEARYNTPGVAAGNWRWRLPVDALTAPLAAQYATLNRIFGRHAEGVRP